VGSIPFTRSIDFRALAQIVQEKIGDFKEFLVCVTQSAVTNAGKMSVTVPRTSGESVSD
jgi:hypothetical protein